MAWFESAPLELMQGSCFTSWFLGSTAMAAVVWTVLLQLTHVYLWAGFHADLSSLELAWPVLLTFLFWHYFGIGKGPSHKIAFLCVVVAKQSRRWQGILLLAFLKLEIEMARDGLNISSKNVWQPRHQLHTNEAMKTRSEIDYKTPSAHKSIGKQ